MKTITIGSIACWLLCNSFVFGAQGWFQAKDFVYSGGPYEDEPFHYQLYVPKVLAKDQDYPLILWMHGFGKAGRNNQAQVAHVSGALVNWESQNGEFPGFILAPQAPEEFASWYADEGESYTGDLLDLPWQILQETIKQYPIDTDRISLVGVSSGGSVCWEMGTRYPDTFASIVPMASTCPPDIDVKKLAGVPIWAFHNERDQGAPIEDVRRAVSSIQKEGGQIRLTTFAEDFHDCWTLAFDQHGLLDWLLLQRRGDSSSPLPGFRRWEWWQYVLVLGLPSLILIALISERRRRRIVCAALSEKELDEHDLQSETGQGIEED